MSSPQTHRSSRFAFALARLRVPAAIVVCLLTLILAVPAAQLSFDRSIESFFARDSPLLQSYLESKSIFGGDEFLIVGYPADDPTSTDALREIEEFSQQLAQVPGIRAESVQDLSRILRNDRAPGWMRIAMRLPAFEDRVLEQSRRMLVSDDLQHVAILMRLEEIEAAPVPRSETFGRVRMLAASHDPPAVVAGEPLQVHDMFDYVEDDALTLGFASTALLFLVILVLFRSWRWVALPVILIHITLLWTKGLLSLSGMQLSMVSSMLTSLVTIIGVATMMHVIVTFREMRVQRTRDVAFVETFTRLVHPIFWTCLTTAVGFAALLISDIVPVRSFAIMMTLGTLLVPIVCCLVIPFGVLFGDTPSDPCAPYGEVRLVKGLRSLGVWSIRQTRSIVGITVLLAVVSFIGVFRLSVETDFSKNFRPASPISQAIHYFESEMGGVGSWEVEFSAPVELTPEFLNKVRDLAADLRSLQRNDRTQLTKVIALTDGLDLVPKVPIDLNGRGGLLPRLRGIREATIDEQREFINTLQPEMEPSLYQPQHGKMRILLRALEQQPAQAKLQLIQRVEEISRKHFPDAEATGLYVLLANLISSLLNDQLRSFLLAAAGVGLGLSIAFRSGWIGLVSMVPNVLPIVVLLGTLGWLGKPVNIGTAMIASVSMGLTVDSTIHYLHTYLHSRRGGSGHTAAAQHAHGHVGLALVLANISLVTGFLVLTLSNFVPLAEFGVLVSMTMLGGLLANVLLMPPLLQWVPVASLLHDDLEQHASTTRVA